MFRWRQSQDRKWKLILVSHTHWDREWYLPFQEFRANLVEAVDSLLDIMARDPGYRYFMLDGQTIVLEDYLEVRPEREDEIKALIGEGRVLFGPWYVMPDEFLVSGESIVRNFLEGRRAESRFGPVMRVGYVPDPFGHVAQLPQILRGFEMDSAVLWRGVSSEMNRDVGHWIAPDGSKVTLLHLPGGYANAAVLPASVDPLMEKVSQIRSELQPRAISSYLLLMNGNDHMLPQPDVPAIIDEANRKLRDAEVIHGTLPMLLDGIRTEMSSDGAEWPRLEGELRSSELAHLLAGVLSARTNVKQRNARCEMLLERWAEPFSCWAAAIGARTNTDEHGQTRTDTDAERQNGGHRAKGEGRQGEAAALLRIAWRHLLQNQPHDSICGCSVDQVHREMETRYDWCEQIAGRVTRRSLEILAGSAGTEALLANSPAQGVVAVFNSESGPRTDFVTLTVDLPVDTAAMALVDPSGHKVPWQVLEEHHTELAGGSIHRSEVQGYLRLSGPGKDWPRWKLKILEKVLKAALRERVPDLVVLNMDVIPGSDPSTVNVEVEVGSGKEHDYDALSAGMRQLTNLVERGDAQYFRLRVSRRGQVEIGLTPREVPGHGMQILHFEADTPATGTVVHAHPETTLENEYLSLQVSPEDGSVRLIDRETGAIYWGLNSLSDGGDVGDEYTYSPPGNDLVVTTPSRPPAVTVEENGPARRTLKVEMEFDVPKSASEDRSSRSKAAVPLIVKSWLQIYPGVPRVDIRTVVENNALDHRLRVLFPTHLSTEMSHADGQFAMIERPTATTVPQRWAEKPVGSHPQMDWVDLSDGESGLMIANRGLREYEVLPEERGPALALTLLRCVGWLSRDDLVTRPGAAGPVVPTPGAQMQGTHTFEYSIIPHPGTWERAFHQGYWFARPLSAAWTGRHGGPLSTSVSFVAVEPQTLVLSAVKPAEDRNGDVILRVYNVLDREQEATIWTFFPLRSANLANLAEEAREPLGVQADGSIRFTIGPRKIMTFRLTPGKWGS